MSGLVVRAHPTIEGVVRVSSDESWPRPHVAIVGALHGNEPCGLRAIDHLREQAEADDLPWSTGTAILVHGNPRASEQKRRYTQGGADLNRLFDFDFEEKLRPESWSFEHHRAIDLRPIFQDIDAALDIHSSTERTTPFVITSRAPGSAELGKALGLAHVTRGWEDLNLLSGKVFLAMLTKRGLPSIAIECGQHGSRAADENARFAALRFLAATGILAGVTDPATDVATLQVVRALRKPSPEFRFARPLIGMELVKAGELLGSDGDIALHAAEDRYVLLPNDGVPVGIDMVYLARPA